MVGSTTNVTVEILFGAACARPRQLAVVELISSVRSSTIIALEDNVSHPGVFTCSDSAKLCWNQAGSTSNFLDPSSFTSRGTFAGGNFERSAVGQCESLELFWRCSGVFDSVHGS